MRLSITLSDLMFLKRRSGSRHSQKVATHQGYARSAGPLYRFATLGVAQPLSAISGLMDALQHDRHKKKDRHIRSGVLPMSAPGQKPTSVVGITMSAPTPKATFVGQPFDVRYVPIADSCTAANYYSISGNSIHIHGVAIRCAGNSDQAQTRRSITALASDLRVMALRSIGLKEP